MKYIIAFILFIVIFSCDEIVKDEPIKKLSQKQQIIEIIDFKISRSNNFQVRTALQDLKYTVIASVK